MFGVASPPRLGRDAAESKTRLLDPPALELQRGAGRYHREGIGGSFATFQIPCVRGEVARRGRQAYCDNEIAGLEPIVAFRRIAGQAMQVFKRKLAPTVRAFDLDDSIEREQRHAQIRWMRGDAALAP